MFFVGNDCVYLLYILVGLILFPILVAVSPFIMRREYAIQLRKRVVDFAGLWF